jgi:predicted metal-dependent hydrolase
MINNFAAADLTMLRKFYEEAFQTLDPERAAPDIEVRFYPYIGINHTIRLRGGKIFVRLAEICHIAPLNVQRALAFILVAKLLRKKVPPLAAQIYHSFVKSREIQAKAIENKLAKGRKITTSPKGEIYDLDEIFARLNKTYFRNSIKKPILSWSARKTYRILGHHDSTHQAIIISKSLDNAKVPAYVAEFVVFHEMLHIFHPTTLRDGRRYNHTPQFRRDEKKFARFTEAENWIEQNAGKLKRSVKRKSEKVKK